MAARARQLVAGQGEEAAVGGEDQQLVSGLGRDQEAQAVALLELQLRGIFHAALGGSNPAAFGQDDGDRLADDHGFDGGVGVDVRGVGEGRAAEVEAAQGGLDLAQAGGDQLPLGLVGGQHAGDAVALLGQFGVLSTDLHLLQPGELAQAGVEDGVGLKVRKAEGLDQPGLGFLLIANDADHLI